MDTESGVGREGDPLFCLSFRQAVLVALAGLALLAACASPRSSAQRQDPTEPLPASLRDAGSTQSSPLVTVSPTPTRIGSVDPLSGGCAGNVQTVIAATMAGAVALTEGAIARPLPKVPNATASVLSAPVESDAKTPAPLVDSGTGVSGRPDGSVTGFGYACWDKVWADTLPVRLDYAGFVNKGIRRHGGDPLYEHEVTFDGNPPAFGQTVYVYIGNGLSLPDVVTAGESITSSPSRIDGSVLIVWLV
jgi:hypothetical protein